MANKTKIEWCDYTINPVKGLCPVGCSYCYARAMYHRYGWPTEIVYDDMVWQKGSPIPKGSKVFVGSTIDLFHNQTKKFMPTILEYCEAVKSRTFIFLTKCPENLMRFSPFPDNCWIGVSCIDQPAFKTACEYLTDIEAPVKFISFEPLLGEIDGDIAWQELYIAGIGWVIVGQQTPVRKNTMPKVQWIYDIVSAADDNRIPVFLKDNLLPVFKEHYQHVHPEEYGGFLLPAWSGHQEGMIQRTFRQEFPKTPVFAQ